MALTWCSASSVCNTRCSSERTQPWRLATFVLMVERVVLPQGRSAAASVRVSVAGDGFAQR